jgi:hypothetical protein
MRYRQDALHYYGLAAIALYFSLYSGFAQAGTIEIPAWAFSRGNVVIDADAPFYGTYRGKRDLKIRDEPDFRLPPLVME